MSKLDVILFGSTNMIFLVFIAGMLFLHSYGVYSVLRRLGFPSDSVLQGFQNYRDRAFLAQSEEKPLLDNMYPVLKNGEHLPQKDMWKYEPVFEVGSFRQITNNIRYPINPDNGSCTPGSMCGVMYGNREWGNNEVHALPQVPFRPDETRVGYYNAKERLVLNLPFTYP